MPADPPRLLLMLAARSRAPGERGGPSKVMTGLIHALAGRCELTVGFTDELPTWEGRTWDLAVWKSRAPAWISIAQRLEGAGIPVLDPLAARELIRDKARCFSLLSESGCPVPKTAPGRDANAVGALLRAGPVVLKPNPGGEGKDIRVVRELSELPELEEGWVAQRYVPGDGWDLKIYVAGERMWAFRKKFSPESFLESGERVDVPADVAEAAAAIGDALGATLYGVDFIRGRDGYVAVDVNWFPSYRNIPGVVDVILEHVLRHAAPRSRP